MKQLCVELQYPHICFVRDFHAGATNIFVGLLEDFCMENDFNISDYALLRCYRRTHSHTLVMHTTQLLG